MAMAGARFAIGLLVVGTAAAASREPLRAYPGERRQLLFLALLFLVQIGLLNQGVFHTTASRASVVIAAHPFFLALFCHFFVPGDRLTPAKVAGILLAFAAVVLVFAESVSLADASHLSGDLMILGSAVLLGLRQTVMKRMVHGFHPYKVLFWQSLLSLPMFAASSAWLEGDAVYDFTQEVVVAVLYQGVVVAGLCFISWVFLLRRHSASQLGVFAFTTPVAGGGAERAAGRRGTVLDAAGEHGLGGVRDCDRGARAACLKTRQIPLPPGWFRICQRRLGRRYPIASTLMPERFVPREYGERSKAANRENRLRRVRGEFACAGTKVACLPGEDLAAHGLRVALDSPNPRERRARPVLPHLLLQLSRPGDR